MRLPATVLMRMLGGWMGTGAVRMDMLAVLMGMRGCMDNQARRMDMPGVCVGSQRRNMGLPRMSSSAPCCKTWGTR